MYIIYIHIYIYNVRPASDACWFRFAPVTIVMSTINHSEIGVINQLSYPTGASHSCPGDASSTVAVSFASAPHSVTSTAQILHGETGSVGPESPAVALRSWGLVRNMVG